MPRVPEYTPQLTPRAAPSAAQSLNVDANAFGGGIAKAAGSFGEGLFAAAGRIQDQADEVAVTAAFNQAIKKQNEYQSAVYGLHGVQAKDAPVMYEQQIGKLRAEVTKDLNPVQQRMFSQRFDSIALSAQDGVNRHTRNQLLTADVDGQKAIIDTALAGYANNITDPAQTVHFRNLAEGAAERLATLTGLDRASLKANTLSQMHIGAVTRLQTLGMNDKATEYLKAHVGEMDENYHSTLLQQSEIDSQITKAQQSVMNLETQYGTDFAKMRDTVWADKALDGQQRDRVLHYIDVKEQENKKAKQQSESFGYENYLKMLNAKQDPSMLTIEQMRQQQFPDALIEHLLKAQLAQKEKAAVEGKARDLMMPLMERIANYGGDGMTEDQLLEERKQIAVALTDIGNMDPTAAAPLSRMFYEKISESRKLDPGVRELIYDRKTGLLPRIVKDVKEASHEPWFSNYMRPQEETAYAYKLWDRVISEVKKHPDWTPADVQDFYDNDPQMKQFRVGKLLRENYKKLLVPSKAQAPFTSPDQIMRPDARR